MSQEKIYIGTGKEISGQYGNFIKLSFHKEDVQKLLDNLSNDWVNITLNQRREPSEKGATHYGVLDTWKPEKRKEEQTAPKKEVTAEDLPF